MVEDRGACDNEDGFSERDREAIGRRLRPYPGWSVFYGTGDGVEYARVSAGGPPGGGLPILFLARQDGQTGFAAVWADGSGFCTALLCSLSAALLHIVQAIEDAVEPCLRDGGEAAALTGASPAPI